MTDLCGIVTLLQGHLAHVVCRRRRPRPAVAFFKAAQAPQPSVAHCSTCQQTCRTRGPVAWRRCGSYSKSNIKRLYTLAPVSPTVPKESSGHRLCGSQNITKVGLCRKHERPSRPKRGTPLCSSKLAGAVGACPAVRIHTLSTLSFLSVSD